LRGVPGVLILAITQLCPWIFEQPNVYLNYQLGNTSLLYHGGRILCLMEGGFPFAISADSTGAISSEGVYDYDGRLKRPMTAHPKMDPLSGEVLLFFSKCAAPLFQSWSPTRLQNRTTSAAISARRRLTGV
jgi:carotenoid cleavage dioxygenase-like enzyme